MRRALAAAAVAVVALTSPVSASPRADSFGNHWAGANGLDTRTAAANAFNQLSAAGYAAHDTVNTDVWTAMSDAQSDAVWVNFGHGAADGQPGGWISWYDPAYSPTTLVLRANQNVGPCTGSGTCLKTNVGTTIHRVRLMVVGGCNSGTNGAGSDAQHSNLVTTAVQYDGVDSSIGFSHEIMFGGGSQPAENWSNSFFYDLRQGATVAAAQSYALTIVESQNNGSGEGFEHYFVLNGSVKIMPPAFGS